MRGASRVRLSVAGFAATAVAFGPARNGYGLFLPYFREEFGLATGLLGLIAGGLHLGYPLALSAVGLLASRVGPLAFIAAGPVSASLHGAGVMVMSALLAIWNAAVFPMRPSAGFSATLVVFGVTFGPVLLSALAAPSASKRRFWLPGGSRSSRGR